MTDRSTLIRDILYFFKTDLASAISDPISSNRSGTSKFIMSSFPQRNVKYPMVTLKITDLNASRAGMQSTLMDITVTMEIRIWARNEKEKDTIYNAIMDRLPNIQYVSSGTIDNDLHDLTIISSVEIDEEGEGGIKSRILQIQYKFFNN